MVSRLAFRAAHVLRRRTIRSRTPNYRREPKSAEDNGRITGRAGQEKAALRGSRGVTYFRGPSVLFPRPFGNNPTLEPSRPSNNPVKNLREAVVTPRATTQTDYGAPITNPMRRLQKASSGKHFYSLPRISATEPARS